MKYPLLIILAVISMACSAREKKTVGRSGKHVVTNRKDGKTLSDSIAIQDTTLHAHMQPIMAHPAYKPGKPQSDTVFNSKGKPVLVKLAGKIFGASIQKFEYDSQDRLIRITGYDDQDHIRPFYHDIAIQINRYDRNGNLIEIRNIGEVGKLISSEFEDTPIILMKYNEKNMLVEERFLDENEKLRSEFAIIRYEYNNRGERITRGWYNEKGEKE